MFFSGVSIFFEVQLWWFRVWWKITEFRRWTLETFIEHTILAGNEWDVRWCRVRRNPTDEMQLDHTATQYRDFPGSSWIPNWPRICVQVFEIWKRPFLSTPRPVIVYTALSAVRRYFIQDTAGRTSERPSEEIQGCVFGLLEALFRPETGAIPTNNSPICWEFPVGSTREGIYGLRILTEPSCLTV